MNMKLIMFLFLVCSIGQAWSMQKKLKKEELKKEATDCLNISDPKLVRYPSILRYIKMVLDEATEKENEKIDI